jgi:ELWxxDGT repeat protein
LLLALVLRFAASLHAQQAAPRLLADIDLGFASSTPRNFIEWDGLVWFQATRTSVTPFEEYLYVTDGTGAGTRQVVLLGTETQNAGFRHPFIAGKQLLFLGRNEKNPRWRSIWRTDGTDVGTWAITPTAYQVCPELLPVAMGDSVLGFVHGDYEGHGVISVDLAKGTTELMGAPFDMWDDATEVPVRFNGAVFLPDRNGERLWRVQAKGSRKEKLELPHLPSLEFSDGTQQFVSLPGAVAILPNGNEMPFDLWRTDGTVAGTAKLGSLPWNKQPAKRIKFHSAGRFALLLVRNERQACTLMSTDGTVSGTQVLLDFDPYKDASFTPPRMTWPNPVVAGDTMYFMADDGVHGLELWRSDGTKNGTRMVVDMSPGTEGSDVNELIPSDDGRVLLMRGSQGEDGGLWITDGTSAGTLFLVSRNTLFISECFASKGRVFLGAERDSDMGCELWVLDLPARSRS